MRQFNKGAGENNVKFPITAQALADLKPCKMVNVSVGISHGVPMAPALCNEAALQEALAEVLQVREDVARGVFPRWFMEKYADGEWGEFPDEIPAPLAHAHNVFNLPKPLSFDDPQGLADVVRMDNPIDLGRVLISWLLNNGCVPKGSSEVSFDFVDIAAGDLAKLTRKIETGLRQTFETKYYYGVARPEEVFGTAAMTHYPEGAPGHPSYPAGHGRVAFDTVKHFLDGWVYRGEHGDEPVPEWIVKALYQSAYIWAMARTFAGVHYAVDNLVYSFKATLYLEQAA